MLTLPRTIALAASALALVACAGDTYQRVSSPPPSSAVPPDACRVYIARKDVTAGSLRNVRVFDGDTEIGVIGEDEYLCWDRSAGRGTGRVVFEGLDYRTQSVENLFDLPREAGTTTWFGISVRREDRKPVIESLGSVDGRALIEKRRPAAKKK